MIRLIVGLGNPGHEYSFNRHNSGRIALESATFLKESGWHSKFKGEFQSQLIAGEKRHFVLPNTYYNLVGESVSAAMKFFKIEPEEVLIVHDELDLEWGRIQLKSGGGLAGNNGLKSVFQHLKTDKFQRLRIGIGRPKHGSVSDYVLSNFPTDIQTEVEIVFKAVDEMLISTLEQGLKKSMQNNNSKKKLF